MRGTEIRKVENQKILDEDVKYKNGPPQNYESFVDSLASNENDDRVVSEYRRDLEVRQRAGYVNHNLESDISKKENDIRVLSQQNNDNSGGYTTELEEAEKELVELKETQEKEINGWEASKEREIEYITATITQLETRIESRTESMNQLSNIQELKGFQVYNKSVQERITKLSSVLSKTNLETLNKQTLEAICKENDIACPSDNTYYAYRQLNQVFTDVKLKQIFKDKNFQDMVDKGKPIPENLDDFLKNNHINLDELDQESKVKYELSFQEFKGLATKYQTLKQKTAELKESIDQINKKSPSMQVKIPELSLAPSDYTLEELNSRYTSYEGSLETTKKQAEHRSGFTSSGKQRMSEKIGHHLEAHRLLTAMKKANAEDFYYLKTQAKKHLQYEVDTEKKNFFRVMVSGRALRNKESRLQQLNGLSFELNKGKKVLGEIIEHQESKLEKMGIKIKEQSSPPTPKGGGAGV